jgi:hypothetical protein
MALHASLMIHLKTLTVFILLTLNLTTIGQTKLPTEKNISQIFENVTKENREASNTTRWSACNLDSSFYKGDTINLINDEGYYLNNKCCTIVDLAFFSKKQFSLHDIQGCQYFSSVSVGSVYKLSFTSIGLFAVVIFTNIGSQNQMKFKVISIDKLVVHYKNDLTILKLVRIK